MRQVKKLASIFAIDIAAYAVMSNHYHLVLRIDTQRSEGWSEFEVLERWSRLFRGAGPVQQFMYACAGADAAGVIPCPTALRSWVRLYRSRLSDVSWFMRVLNETIARRANAEDAVSGRFWEGRFKSQALLDDRAVLAAMAYVDLNPIRAGMASTPEDSRYTSVAERLADVKGWHGKQVHHANTLVAVRDHARADGGADGESVMGNAPRARQSVSGAKRRSRLRLESRLASLPLKQLMPFSAQNQNRPAIPFTMGEYFALIETAGRTLHTGKRGSMAHDTPPLLMRLGIDSDCFDQCMSRLMALFATAVGSVENLRALCKVRGIRHLHGIGPARRIFGPG